MSLTGMACEIIRHAGFFVPYEINSETALFPHHLHRPNFQIFRLTRKLDADANHRLP
jgi:hypothetical protein